MPLANQAKKMGFQSPQAAILLRCAMPIGAMPLWTPLIRTNATHLPCIEKLCWLEDREVLLQGEKARNFV